MRRTRAVSERRTDVRTDARRGRGRDSDDSDAATGSERRTIAEDLNRRLPHCSHTLVAAAAAADRPASISLQYNYTHDANATAILRQLPQALLYSVVLLPGAGSRRRCCYYVSQTTAGRAAGSQTGYRLLT